MLFNLISLFQYEYYILNYMSKKTILFIQEYKILIKKL